MLDLDRIPTKDYWLPPLRHGVEVKVRPLTTPVYEAALASGRRRAREMGAKHVELSAAGARIEGLPDLSDPDGLAGYTQLLFVQALARAAILEWKGVGRSGAPIPFSADVCDELMLVHGVAEDFVTLYTANYALLVAEGNGSGASPNGTMAAAPNTAVPAAQTASPVQMAG